MMPKTESKNKLLFIFVTSMIALLSFSFALAEATLDKGPVVNAKMRTVTADSVHENTKDSSSIKSIRMADALPDHFIPSEANTVSAADSEYPVYIFFDNEENAGILYFYTEGETITMNRDSSYLFANNEFLTDISGLGKWDASNVAWMNGAFFYDSSLSSLSPLANWDTGNVTSLAQTFQGDAALSDISGLANWDTSNVRDMFALFGGAKSLNDALALRNWDTSNTTDMSFMFSGCTSLLFVDVSNWNTGKVTTMASMFQVGDSWKSNGQMREINGLGNLDVSNVTDMTCMFYGAGQMTYYDIAGWDVSKVESMNHMFCDNRSLRSLDLSDWDVSSLKTVYCMFDDNVKLKTIGDVSHWNTSNLIDAGGWLNDAFSFIGDEYGTLDLSGWDTRNLKTVGEMFLQTSLHTIDLSGWIFDSITNDTWDGADSGIYYETGNDSEPLRGFGSMFKDSTKLTAVYVSQSGLDSYNTVVENGVNTLDMWTHAKTEGFTVK